MQIFNEVARIMGNMDGLTIANVAALITVAGVGISLIARMARTELKVDLMWADFRRRMPKARSDDADESQQDA